jgi:hypothetical protein
MGLQQVATKQWQTATQHDVAATAAWAPASGACGRSHKMYTAACGTAKRQNLKNGWQYDGSSAVEHLLLVLHAKQQRESSALSWCQATAIERPHTCNASSFLRVADFSGSIFGLQRSSLKPPFSETTNPDFGSTGCSTAGDFCIQHKGSSKADEQQRGNQLMTSIVNNMLKVHLAVVIEQSTSRLHTAAALLLNS